MSFLQQLVTEYGTPWIIGQIFGIIGTILGFISYQVRTQRQLLFMQSTVSVVFCIHFLLIGAYSGMAMNVVSIFRNFVYDYRIRKDLSGKLIPCVFVALQGSMCILSWEAWYSIFVLLGNCINTYCMSFKDAQKVRKSILITSPLVWTYDLLAGSVGGSIYEPVSLISAITGILKNRRRKAE